MSEAERERKEDLVKRLRDGCSCNIDTSPCAAEEECRDAYAAADRIEALEAKLSKSEALLAKAVEALKFHNAAIELCSGGVTWAMIEAYHHSKRTLAELTGGKDD